MSFSASKLLAELPRLRRYARILTDDPARADRLVEATLARARLAQDASQSESKADTQLLALLRSVYSDQCAAGHSPVVRPAPVAERFSAVEPGPRGRTGNSSPDRGAEMLAQLFRLPLEQREVMVLVAVERLSYEEIAGLLALPTATVIARLSQAREALHASPSMPRSAPSNAG